jgi:hypothetical protein
MASLRTPKLAKAIRNWVKSFQSNRDHRALRASFSQQAKQGQVKIWKLLKSFQLHRDHRALRTSFSLLP